DTDRVGVREVAGVWNEAELHPRPQDGYEHGPVVVGEAGDVEGVEDVRVRRRLGLRGGGAGLRGLTGYAGEEVPSGDALLRRLGLRGPEPVEDAHRSASTPTSGGATPSRCSTRSPRRRAPH